MSDAYYDPSEWWTPRPDYEPPSEGRPARLTITPNDGQNGVAKLMSNNPEAAHDQGNPLQVLVRDQAGGMGELQVAQNELDKRGIIDKLLGLTGPRYQTWPEHMVRSAITAPKEAYDTGTMTMTDPYGKVTDRQLLIDAVTGMPTDPVIQRAMDLGGAALVGGMPGAARGALGSAGGKLVQPAADVVAPVFYSGVERALEGITQKAATGEQWLNTLRNKPGVKPEEMAWTGVDDFLASKAGEKISKDELAAYIKEHKTEIKEIENTGKIPDSVVEEYALDMQRDAIREGERDHGLDFFRQLARETLADDPELAGVYTTKFNKYQLPGGENYRELLLTLPKKNDVRLSEISDRLNELEPEKYKTIETAQEYKKLQDERSKLYTDQRGTEYNGSHWNEPNVLAHVRMNDRNIPGVGKSLHLEEVQSDWHQTGRKHGYKKLTSKPSAEIQKIVGKMLPGQEGRHPDTIGIATIEANVGKRLTRQEADKLLDWIKARHNKNYLGVPDAPFKSTWADLALKRAISKAAREGYDSISWTPGEQQAARYDLSKQLKKIQYNEDTKDLHAYDHNNRNVLAKTNVKPENLADYVGKDVADKLMKQNRADNGLGGNGYRELSGLDLKVGGEGMKSFYDKMLVDKANKLAKQFGGKVEWQELHPGLNTGKLKDTGVGGMKFWAANPDGSVKYFTTQAGVDKFLAEMNPKVPVLRLTDSMKQAASTGFPLYVQGTPLILTPVDHDPFKDVKNGKQSKDDFQTAWQQGRGL